VKRATAEEQIYITGTELRRRLAISKSTVHRHALNRFALKVGGTWRYRFQDIVRHYENAMGNGRRQKKSCET
jgi:hypothetical protein